MLAGDSPGTTRLHGGSPGVVEVRRPSVARTVRDVTAPRHFVVQPCPRVVVMTATVMRCPLFLLPVNDRRVAHGCPALALQQNGCLLLASLDL